MSAAAKRDALMTVAEFANWNPEDGRRWQLVDGEPEAMAPASRTHAALISELATDLTIFFRQQRSPCSVLTAPGVLPHVNATHNCRVPDLAVTCSGYDKEEWHVTDPVLIVEVLSPGNRKQTRANVWAYTSIPSVREIVVLHSTSIAAEILRRLPDASWPMEPDLVTGGELTLESIGCRLPLESLYRTTRLAQR